MMILYIILWKSKQFKTLFFHVLINQVHDRLNMMEIIKWSFRLSKKKVPALKIELINGRGNFLYLSLVEYKRETYLCVIDNISSSSIGAFVLDYAEQENVKTNVFLSVVTKWFYSRSDLHPLSIEIARLGLTEQLAPIYKTFDTSYVSRIIGNAFSYDALQKTKVKRRRVIPIPEGIPITLKKSI